MQKGPILIELIGPTGSGKSTFVETALTKSRRFDTTEIAAFRGLLHHPNILVPCKYILRHIPLRLAYKLRITKITNFYRDQILTLNETRAYAHLFEYVFASIHALDASPERKVLLFHRFLCTITDHILVMQDVNHGRKVLADEYFLQKIFALFPGNKNDHSEKYWALIPTPHIILEFKTDVKTCLERVKTRKNGRNILSNADEDELANRIATCAKRTSEITKRYSNENVPSIIVTAGSETEVVHDLLRHD